MYTYIQLTIVESDMKEEKKTCTNFFHGWSLYLGNCRVIYDRVLNEKNDFEIPAFFMFEQGKSRVGYTK